jgi:hypothetical protein
MRVFVYDSDGATEVGDQVDQADAKARVRAWCAPDGTEDKTNWPALLDGLALSVDLAARAEDAPKGETVTLPPLVGTDVGTAIGLAALVGKLVGFTPTWLLTAYDSVNAAVPGFCVARMAMSHKLRDWEVGVLWRLIGTFTSEECGHVIAQTAGGMHQLGFTPDEVRSLREQSTVDDAP